VNSLVGAVRINFPVVSTHWPQPGHNIGSTCDETLGSAEFLITNGGFSVVFASGAKRGEKFSFTVTPDAGEPRRETILFQLRDAIDQNRKSKRTESRA
jgi:hypothetical protein